MSRAAGSLLLLLFAAASAFSQQLPRSVLPTHYELTFTPDFASDRFDGETNIHVIVAEPTKEVVLNAFNLEFLDTRIDAQTATVTTEPGLAKLTVAEILPSGPAVIRIRYRGTLNRNLRGLYLGEAKGKKYASTQMEATDAREAFPSFDEPEMKATFAITAIVDDGHVAISNGAQLSDTPGPTPGKHTVRFATTPRMSTYLVALTIGDFGCLRDVADGIPVGICGTADKLPIGKFAMETTKFVLPWYNDYYGIRYPFGKLDQTGVADFRLGAMENAGSILYRDVYLFGDEAQSTPSDNRLRASIISHEIAHMWFGDIVTMRWWDDIWLNEGFATWAASKPIEKWRPDWKMPLRDLDATGFAMNSDSLRTSRKIRQQASTPDQIAELFDGIAYQKTAAVLRMIESLIGEEAMRKGVSSYLKRHAWGNTTYHDFAEAITEVSSQPVDEILESFVDQPGVPLLHVSSTCENGETLLTVEQERYFDDPVDRTGSGDQRWTLPVCFGSGGYVDQVKRECRVMRERKETLRAPGCGAPLFLNAGGSGYYIVEHSLAMLDALSASVSTLGPAEKIVLLRDEWNLVRSARRPVGSYLALAEAMRGEREPIVVTNVINKFAAVRENIAADADRPAFEAWVRSYVQPIVKELGWSPKSGESSDQRDLRAEALATLLIAGNDLSVAREARKLVERNLAGKLTLDPQLRKTLIMIAAREGDAALYDRLLKAQRNAVTPDDQYLFRFALAAFRNPELRRRTFEWTLTDEMRNQDAGWLMGNVVYARYGTDRAGSWRWIEENWPRIQKKVPEPMQGDVVAAAGVLCDRESLARVKAFIEAHPVPSAERRNAQSLERIAQCAALKEIQSTKLHEWIARR
ncbi:MAG TPA: M1 family metallopeptidase [Thermoanaerobaculia bacterium]|jgi:aminopeptidase N|nr:M1 family metallopeptidase [Thermoanaerobaculia bacterium]